MTTEDFQKVQGTIEQKLGKDVFAKISNEMVSLMSDNSQMNKDISERDSKITQLNKDKNELVETNGVLMKKVSVGFTEDLQNTSLNNNKNVETKKPSYRSCFDENGNFKK